jgi:protein-tyrosine phosphatase
MGNICRSPTAEGVFRHLVEEEGLASRIQTDSAGTHASAERRGISLENIRARRVHDEDFERFDYVIAMDRDNLEVLVDQSEPEHHQKIRLFLEFSAGHEDEVPDPYYGGAAGFERVLDLVEEASRGLLETLRSEL